MATESWRPRVTAVGAAVVVAALGYSVWHDVPHSRGLLATQYGEFAGYTRDQRDRAFGTSIPMPMEILDFWRSELRPEDRYWIQMPPEPFSSNGDKRYIARTIAHIYLLPAIETLSLADADVVLSWDENPSTLHLRYFEQHQVGVQPIFVSRINRGF
jgi:hypothetical protein